MSGLRVPALAAREVAAPATSDGDPGTVATSVAEYDIAYQGTRGAFSEDAALTYAGRMSLDTPRLLPRPRLDEVFDAVASGRATVGVVPIENTLAGSVQACYDLLRERDLTITGELVQRISHALVARPGMAIDDLRRVLSHPVALAQCTEFFRSHPGVEIVAVYDTAGAVQQVIESGSTTDAAIAGRRTAAVYGGEVLAAPLEDDPENYTRFLVVEPSAERARTAAGHPRECKTSVVFTLANRPGALHAVLRHFADHGIDLSLIESRPRRGRPFEYAFYVDVAGHADEAPLDVALDGVRAEALELDVLGSYARQRDVVPGGRA